MDLGVVFKLSLYTLTALVGAILGTAESEGIAYGNGRLAIPFLSIPIVICGYLYSERQRKSSNSATPGLSSVWANVLGVIALLATVYEFTRERQEAKLLAGTHLLLYATWIVLFQQKTVRLYWFLMALGILQLAVASVLTTKGWFGVCALGYMFSAVWTLSIFSLWRAEQNFKSEEDQRLADTTARWRDKDEAGAGVSELNSEVRSAVQHEDGAHWLNGRFVTGVLLTSCSALLVSAAFFAFVPRVWGVSMTPTNSDSESQARAGRRTVLSPTVRLGGLGTILESMERVFEIQIKNKKTDSPISAQDYAEQLGMAEPLFRGSVLTYYENGSWRAASRERTSHLRFPPQYQALPIEQSIRLDSKETGVLFALGQPLIVLDPRKDQIGELDELTGVVLMTDSRLDSGVMIYNAYSALPLKRPQHYVHSVSPAVKHAYHRNQFEETKNPSAKLQRLNKLAREVVKQEASRRQKVEGLSEPKELAPLEKAIAIEAFLRDSGQFAYSLDLSIKDATIDPIEDFLFNRKEGHCEYFATALALMLRAAGVPARLVTGYKGGVVRQDRKDWLEVQQRFAHAWVEAWVDERGWTTFDATPADARSLSVMSVASKRSSLWTDVQSTLSGLWSDNILNMSLDRQEESIYKPLREFALSTLTFIKKLWTSPASALKTVFEVLSNRKRWLSVTGGLIAFFLMLFVAGVVAITRWMIRRIRTWMSDQANRRTLKKHRFVEFYERFIALMQKHGLNRLPTQTQQEFAEAVSSAYSPELTAEGLNNFPRLISSMFYQVRFGETDLSEPEIRNIDQLLTRFEQILSTDPQRS